MITSEGHHATSGTMSLALPPASVEQFWVCACFLVQQAASPQLVENIQGCVRHGMVQVVDLLRQRARPYLFSNTLAPAMAGAGLKVWFYMNPGCD